MLPMHGNTAPRGAGGWREMTIVTDGASPSYRRILRIKPLRSVSRLTFVVAGGAIFCLWLMITQFDALSFTRPYPQPHGRPPPGVHRPHFDFDLDDAPELPPPSRPESPAAPVSTVDWEARAEEVKKMFVRAYHAYEKYASPADELRPMTNGTIDNFNGWGLTMVDSLDTMHLMGLHDEFNRGVDQLRGLSFTANNRTNAPFFETVIRYLGGLLSGYAFSRDPLLLQRADELGAALLPAFNTKSGFPTYSVRIATGSPSVNSAGWLAEIASCMMEYKYLAKVTGKKEYYDAADTVMRKLYAANITKYPGELLPSQWDLTTGQPLNDQITIGAMADSAYEYFLKQYLLTNRTETESLTLYLRTMRGILDYTLYLSPKRSLLYVTDISARRLTPTRKFEHLSCFLPGLLALGAQQLPQSAFLPYSDFAEPDEIPSELQRHVWAAEGLAIACGAIYADMPCGLGPDEVIVMSESEIERELVYKELQEARERERLLIEKGKELEDQLKRERRAPAPAPGPAPAPPHGNWPGGSRPKIAPSTATKVNQTESDEKLLWRNALDAWRDGRYDGRTNEYLLPVDGEWHGGKWEGDGKIKGSVPGLRDPPYDAPAGSEMRDYKTRNPSYNLRPETIESFFIMWRTTGNEVWRERGWAAFEAIEKYTRTDSAYAAIKNTFDELAPLQDSMPSFFLAETLKYLYLLFSDESLLPLDKYVFNTEAHPFPVFEWTAEEKIGFGID